MKVYFQKMTAVVLLIMTVLVLFVPYTAMAAEGTDTYMIENLDTSNVEDDLKVMKIKDEKGQFTKTFNFEDYPLEKGDAYTNSSDRIELIAFYEKGYTKAEGVGEDFGVYLYFYNPTGKEIKSFDNAVNMAQEVNDDNSSTSFERVKIDLLSASSDWRFLKFKLMPREDQVPFVIVNYMGEEYRGYDIAAVYLNDGKDIKSYKNGITYLLSGYEEDETLTVRGDQRMVVDLQLKQTWYRLNSSPLGKDHYSTMNSVYFSIPKSIMTEGTTLTGAEMEWYEYKTEPVLYCTNEKTAEKFVAKNGNIGDSVLLGVSVNSFLEQLGSHYEWFLGSPDNDEEDDILISYKDKYYAYSGAYYVPNAGYRDGMKILVDGKGEEITGERILGQIQNWSQQYIGYRDPDIWVKGAAGKYASTYFSNSVDEGRTRGYNRLVLSDKRLQYVEAWESDFLGPFGTWIEYGWNVPDWDAPIDYPQVDEWTGNHKNKDLTARDYGTNNYDLAEIKEDLEYAEARNERVFVLRFATTDYYYGWAEHEDYDGEIYISTQTCFLNLNVLSLSVERDGQQVVIPVSSDPIDVMPDPTTGEKNNMLGGIFDVTIIENISDIFQRLASFLGPVFVLAVVVFCFIMFRKVLRKYQEKKGEAKEAERRKQLQKEHDEDRAWTMEERRAKRARDIEEFWEREKKKPFHVKEQEKERADYMVNKGKTMKTPERKLLSAPKEKKD